MIKTPNFFIVKVIGVLIEELIENKSYERYMIEKKRAAVKEQFQICPNFSNWPMIDTSYIMWMWRLNQEAPKI